MNCQKTTVAVFFLLHYKGDKVAEKIWFGKGGEKKTNGRIWPKKAKTDDNVGGNESRHSEGEKNLVSLLRMN